MQGFDVVSVGGAVVDLFVKTHPEIISINSSSVFKREELIAYPVGSKILIESLHRDFGGGGFNVGVSLARLGLRVGFLGCVGKDFNGELIMKRMKNENITFLGHFSNQETGFSIILDTDDEDRTILAFRGANDYFDFKLVNKKLLRTRWFFISSLTREGFESSKRIVDFALKHNIKLAFNPSTYLARFGFKRLRKIITNLDVLVLNRVEGSFITELDSVREMLVWLKDFVKDVVVITDGKNGAFAFDGVFFYRIKAPQIKVKETTGAGDSFASTFLYSWIKNKGVVLSLKLGMVNALSVVRHIGAQTGLLSEKKLLLNFKRLNKKLVVRKSHDFIL